MKFQAESFRIKGAMEAETGQLSFESPCIYVSGKRRNSAFAQMPRQLRKCLRRQATGEINRPLASFSYCRDWQAFAQMPAQLGN